MTGDPISVSVADAAVSVGVSERKIYDLLNRGLIAGRYSGAKRLVDYASLRNWYASLPQERED